MRNDTPAPSRRRPRSVPMLVTSSQRPLLLGAACGARSSRRAAGGAGAARAPGQARAASHARRAFPVQLHTTAAGACLHRLKFVGERVPAGKPMLCGGGQRHPRHARARSAHCCAPPTATRLAAADGGGGAGCRGSSRAPAVQSSTASSVRGASSGATARAARRRLAAISTGMRSATGSGAVVSRERGVDSSERWSSSGGWWCAATTTRPGVGRARRVAIALPDAILRAARCALNRTLAGEVVAGMPAKFSARSCELALQGRTTARRLLRPTLATARAAYSDAVHCF